MRDMHIARHRLSKVASSHSLILPASLEQRTAVYGGAAAAACLKFHATKYRVTLSFT